MMRHSTWEDDGLNLVCPNCKRAFLVCNLCGYTNVSKTRDDTSELDKIKERVYGFKKDWEASRGCCDVDDFSDDVLYLIARLEVAERVKKDGPATNS